MTSYDLRVGAGRLHDRYFFYVVPLLLVACAAMCLERPWRRWPIVAAGALLAVAFSFLTVVSYDKFNVDSPVALMNEPLLGIAGSEAGAQLLLGFITIVATMLLLTRRRLALALVAVAAAGMLAQTGGAFTRLLAHNGTSGRPLTQDQSVVFDWLDRRAGTGADVTMIPYPLLPGTYWENVSYWWNVEFWNVSVEHAVVYQGAFSGTPETFPTNQLTFDPKTGGASWSGPGLVATAVAETRFHLAGKALDADNRGLVLVRPERPWRADWLGLDFYRDGWTIPKVTGRVRVFAAPGQQAPERRYVTFTVKRLRNIGPREFTIRSNAGTWPASADPDGTSLQVSVCVPAHGFADIRVDAPHYSPIYGDPRSEASFFSYARSGGVLLAGIALADEVGSC